MRRKVTIFGSARSHPSDPEYKQALHFRASRQARFHDHHRRRPGHYEGGQRRSGERNSFGINIRLPFEQEANKFISRDPRFIDCRFFFTRKLMFLKETSAVAFFPGGFGTHDEGFESLTLVQTGKCDPLPIVFVGQTRRGLLAGLAAYIVKQLLKKGKIARGYEPLQGDRFRRGSGAGDHALLQQLPFHAFRQGPVGPAP